MIVLRLSGTTCQKRWMRFTFTLYFDSLVSILKNVRMRLEIVLFSITLWFQTGLGQVKLAHQYCQKSSECGLKTLEICGCTTTYIFNKKFANLYDKSLRTEPCSSGSCGMSLEYVASVICKMKAHEKFGKCIGVCKNTLDSSTKSYPCQH